MYWSFGNYAESTINIIGITWLWAEGDCLWISFNKQAFISKCIGRSSLKNLFENRWLKLIQNRMPEIK